MAKKINYRSEAAQRRAIKKWLKDGGVRFHTLADDGTMTVCAYDMDRRVSESLIAIFDLRDCFRKRAPLTGVTKSLRKAIQPKRKK